MLVLEENISSCSNWKEYYAQMTQSTKKRVKENILKKSTRMDVSFLLNRLEIYVWDVSLELAGLSSLWAIIQLKNHPHAPKLSEMMVSHFIEMEKLLFHSHFR